jgi:hypothetical protein
MPETPRRRVFVVHHNPNNGRYRYPADPRDAIASAQAMIDYGDGAWVAGNCRRMIGVGDLLLFKFGGARLKQQAGIYAAARVTRAPSQKRSGTWILRYQPDESLTRRLMKSPITGRKLEQLVPRSFGASIQAVKDGRLTGLGALLSDATAGTAEPTHGLLIHKEWLDKIFAGAKTWEIRGKATARRGPIALIESKSGHVVGTCEVVDVIGPLTLATLNKNAHRTGFRARALPYPTTYAWAVRDARRLPEPVPYRHPSGAVIWVKLEPKVLSRLRRAGPTA